MKEIKYSELELLEVFINAIKALFSYDKTLFSKKKNRLAISHRIAVYLEKELKDLTSDLSYHTLIKKKDYYPDILLHDRKDVIALSLFWANDYLSKKDQDDITAFIKAEDPALSLGLSFLPDKDYILIYRFKDNYTDYIHLNKTNFERKFLKRLEDEVEEDKSQQLLFAPKKRKTTK